MKLTNDHLILWNRRNKPSWASKIETPKVKGFFAPKEDTGEIHRIINGRVGIKVTSHYKVGNAINLYRLARHNAMREKGRFDLAEYASKMFGGGSDEHKKHFDRWIRKLKNKA